MAQEPKLTFTGWCKLAWLHWTAYDPPAYAWYTAETARERAHHEEFESGREITAVGGWLLNAWDYLFWPFMIGRCELFGHKLVDDSYGGPDSGTMGVRCTRCGYSHSVRMY